MLKKNSPQFSHLSILSLALTRMVGYGTWSLFIPFHPAINPNVRTRLHRFSLTIQPLSQLSPYFRISTTVVHQAGGPLASPPFQPHSCPPPPGFLHHTIRQGGGVHPTLLDLALHCSSNQVSTRAQVFTFKFPAQLRGSWLTPRSSPSRVM